MQLFVQDCIDNESIQFLVNGHLNHKSDDETNKNRPITEGETLAENQHTKEIKEL